MEEGTLIAWAGMQTYEPLDLNAFNHVNVDQFSRLRLHLYSAGMLLLFNCRKACLWRPLQEYAFKNIQKDLYLVFSGELGLSKELLSQISLVVNALAFALIIQIRSIYFSIITQSVFLIMWRP